MPDTLALARSSQLLEALCEGGAPALSSLDALPSVLAIAASSRDAAFTAAQLRAALDALAEASLVLPPADEPGGGFTWVTYFSEAPLTIGAGAEGHAARTPAWYPLLRARPTSALVELWGAAQYLALPDAHLAPLAREAAQRALNWSLSSLDALGDAECAGSLRAAASLAHTTIVEPLLTLLTRRCTDPFLLHGDSWEVACRFECMPSTGQSGLEGQRDVDARSWVRCKCEAALRLGLGSLGQSLPPLPVLRAFAAANAAPDDWKPLPMHLGAWAVVAAARGLVSERMVLPWLVAFGRHSLAARVLTTVPRALGVRVPAFSRNGESFVEVFSSPRDVVRVAALTGSIERTRWAATFVGVDVADAVQQRGVASSAARAGHVRLLQWLAEQVGILPGAAALGDAWTAWALYAYETPCAPPLVQQAIIGGHVPALDWLFRMHCAATGDELTAKASFFSIMRGGSDAMLFFGDVGESGANESLPSTYLPAPGVVRWSVDAGLRDSFDEEFIEAVAAMGDLDGIQALYDRNGVCTYSYVEHPAVLCQAIRFQQLRIVEWLHERGVRGDYCAVLAICEALFAGDCGDDEVRAAFAATFTRGLPQLSVADQARVCSAEDVPFAVVEYLHEEHSYAIDEHAFISCGPEEITYLLNAGCPRGSADHQAMLCASAAQFGWIESLQLLLNAGFAMDSSVFSGVLSPRGGCSVDEALRVLRFLVDQGAPRGEAREQRALCARAAAKSLDALKFLRSTSPPFEWGPSVFSEPVVLRSSEVLRYLLEEGAPRGSMEKQHALCASAARVSFAALKLLRSPTLSPTWPPIDWGPSVFRGLFRGSQFSLDALRYLIRECAPRGSVKEQRATCASAACSSASPLAALQLLRCASPPFEWDATLYAPPKGGLAAFDAWQWAAAHGLAETIDTCRRFEERCSHYRYEQADVAAHRAWLLSRPGGCPCRGVLHGGGEKEGARDAKRARTE